MFKQLVNTQMNNILIDKYIWLQHNNVISTEKCYCNY